MDEILVQKVNVKEGVKNNRAWKRWGIQDGNGDWYNAATFKEGFKQEWVPLFVEGARLRIEYQSEPFNGRVQKNLTVVESATNGSVPETYSHQRPDGEPDWDKVALGKTRSAAWNAFLSGHLAANLYAKVVADNAKTDQKRDPIDYIIVTGTRLVVHAERDVFERPAGGDGVPFLGEPDAS